MLIRSIVGLFLLISMSAEAQTQYVIRKGDTLLKISDRALGITNRNDVRRYQYLRKLLALNPDLRNPNALEPGQTILVPTEGNSDEKAVAEEKPALAPPPPPPPTPKAEEPPPPVVTETQTPLDSASKTKTPVPQTSPLPSAPVAPPVVEKKVDEHADFFVLQPRYQKLKIKAKDKATETEASMEATSSFGLDLQYGRIINERFHFLFQVGVTQTQFKDIESTTGAAVNHKSETLKSFAVGLAYEATHTLHLDVMAVFADRTFLLPATSPDYELAGVMLPGAEVNLSWDFFSGTTSIFGISAIGEYVANGKKGDVDIKSVFEPLGALYWKSNFGERRMNYKVTLTYKHGHQNTSISEQKEDLLGLGVGFYF